MATKTSGSKDYSIKRGGQLQYLNFPGSQTYQVLGISQEAQAILTLNKPHCLVVNDRVYIVDPEVCPGSQGAYSVVASISETQVRIDLDASIHGRDSAVGVDLPECYLTKISTALVGSTLFGELYHPEYAVTYSTGAPSASGVLGDFYISVGGSVAAIPSKIRVPSIGFESTVLSSSPYEVECDSECKTPSTLFSIADPAPSTFTGKSWVGTMESTNQSPGLKHSDFTVDHGVEPGSFSFQFPVLEKLRLKYYIRQALANEVIVIQEGWVEYE